MKELNYISVNSIIAKLIRDLGIETVNEDDIVEWTGEALDSIESPGLLEEAVAFIEVENHIAKLPRFIDSIIQVARKHRWYKKDESCTPQRILDNIEETKPETSTTCYSGCGGGTCSLDLVPLDCDGSPLFDTELVYYRPYYDFKAEYFDWRNSGYYKNDWGPVRLSNHTFFSSIVCPEEEGLHSNSQDEYTIIANKQLRLSFREGFIAVSYLRKVTDEQGYPMIPDQYSYTTAVVKYITMMLLTREWYAGRQGSQSKMQKAEADWQWYAKQASNRGLMPRGIDQFENMLQQRNYLLPRVHRYNQFFKNMSRQEDRTFLNPDRRHNR